jgi:ribose 5-phosphate isomerase B
VRVYLGSDHAGFELKATLVAALEKAGHEPVDCGPRSYDADDDYPVYVLRAAEGVIGDPGSLGIVIGGSGNGEQIAANKVTGIRAALAWTTETAALARQHNDANVLSLGARQYSIDDAVSFALTFVETPFSEDPRHVRRLAMVSEYEKSGTLPPLLSGGYTPIFRGVHTNPPDPPPAQPPSVHRAAPRGVPHASLPGPRGLARSLEAALAGLLRLAASVSPPGLPSIRVRCSLATPRGLRLPVQVAHRACARLLALAPSRGLRFLPGRHPGSPSNRRNSHLLADARRLGRASRRSALSSSRPYETITRN